MAKAYLCIPGKGSTAAAQASLDDICLITVYSGLWPHVSTYLVFY